MPKIAQTSRGPVEYRLEGDGPVVVVLNGGHCSRDTRLSHERLSTVGFSVLTPSRPGYDSTPAGVGRSAQEAADAIAALLDTLDISRVSLIGISAAGPTALAFAMQHPERLHKLILESAVTTPWHASVKKHAKFLFGPSEKLTWALSRSLLRLFRDTVIRMLMGQISTLPIDQVMARMSQEDLDFVRDLLMTSRSGEGFINDIEHRVETLSDIQSPTLVMFSPHDKAVPPVNAFRVAGEINNCELFEVPADSHLIWIGQAAELVWQKRLEFLA